MINSIYRQVLNTLVKSKTGVVQDFAIMVERDQPFPIIQTYPVDFNKCVVDLLHMLDKSSYVEGECNIASVLNGVYGVDQIYNAIVGIMVENPSFVNIVGFSVQNPSASRLISVRLYAAENKTDELYPVNEVMMVASLTYADAIEEFPRDLVMLRLAQMLLVRELNMRAGSDAYKLGSLFVAYDMLYLDDKELGQKIADHGLTVSECSIQFTNNNLKAGSLRSESEDRFLQTTLRPEDIILLGYEPVGREEYLE